MSNEPEPCQATPADDLRQQIMDSRVGKNEREWWASRTIEKLERELSDRDSGYMRGSRAILDSALMWKDRAEKSEAQLAAAIARAEHAEAIIRSLCKICSTPIGATSEDSK